MGLGWQGFVGGLQHIFNQSGSVSQPIAEQNQAAAFAPSALQPEDLLVYLPVRLHEDAKEKLAAIESPEALAHVATALHYRCATYLHGLGINMGFLKADEPMKFNTSLQREWDPDKQTLSHLDLTANIPTETHDFFVKAENEVGLQTANYFSGFIDEAVQEKFGCVASANRNFTLLQQQSFSSPLRREYLENSNQEICRIGKPWEYQDGKKIKPIPFDLDAGDITARRLQASHALEKLAKLVRSLPDDVNASRQFLESAIQTIERVGLMGVENLPDNQQSLGKPKPSQGLRL